MDYGKNKECVVSPRAGVQHEINSCMCQCVPVIFDVYSCAHICAMAKLRGMHHKPPVDLLPNYLDSQWTVSISFGQISMFFHFGHRSSPV